MNRQDFRQEYSSIASALGSHFHDSSGQDDQMLARDIRKDLPADRRAKLIERILADTGRLMQNLDECWDLVAEAANRQLADKDVTRTWLTEMTIEWQQELERLKQK